VVDASLEQILAAGQFEGVREFLDGSAGPQDRPAALVLRSRLEFARGSLAKAIQLARLAANGADAGPHSGIALLNLATILGVSGFADEARELAASALTHPLTEAQRQVAKATVLMWEAGHRGDLAAIADELRALARRQDTEGHVRYASITRLNLAAVLMWLAEPEESLAVSISAEVGFRQSGAPDIEKGAALAARATALAHVGRLNEAISLLVQAGSSRSALAREEASLETAKLLSDLGDLNDAAEALDHVGPTALDAGFLGLWALISGALALRRGDIESAKLGLGQLVDSPCHDVGGELRGQLLRTRIGVATQSDHAGPDAEVLRDIAIAQRSRPGRLLADILSAMAVGADLSGAVLQPGPEDGPVLSIVAEELARNLDQMSSAARGQVTAEAVKYPERWRSALRLALKDVSPTRATASTVPVASLLGRIGSAEDVTLFRSLGSTNRAYRAHAAGLARRLAPPVMIRDLGVVEVLLGGRSVARPVRRKVLGLLCFLASRPNQAATRDEALEALWPDLGPDTAANSLHQTIYFLRRVFEPEYREGFSAGYVVFDGEVVSLDAHLVDSSSRRCWRLIKESGRTGREHLSQLLETYSGRFALDFAYEEWATDYRETLHAAVLAIVEGAISAAFDRRDFDRTIELAHAALLLDPTADSVELILLRAYKASGRTAAAAEQYAHYSSLLREQLGVEPPLLADV
jgi:DNA-binding SARP family transcriptional activator